MEGQRNETTYSKLENATQKEEGEILKKEYIFCRAVQGRKRKREREAKEEEKERMEKTIQKYNNIRGQNNIQANTKYNLYLYQLF